MSRVKISKLSTFIAVVIVIGIAGRCWYSKRQPVENAGSSPRYVGDQSCRSCHSTIYDSYKRTAMGRAWYRPTPDNVVEDYLENNHVYDPTRDLHYDMLAREGEFFQREYRLGEDGNVTHELIRKADYVVGSGEHVRTYAADAGGFLTQLPISWYTDHKKWGLSPGYEIFNQRFSRPIAPACIGCHNDYPTHFTASLNRYESPVPSGIGCERCHGPAEWHVREQTEAWRPPGHQAVSPAIVNPAQLPGSLKDDVCFQCHLQGDTEFVNPGKDQYGFRPGLRLADFRSVYFAKTADSDTFGIASHAARMVQSRCYIEAKGEFSCVTCHDPHVPLREVSAASYRGACLNCHTESSCRRNPDSSTAHQQNDCVGCHMPRGQPTDVQHTVFTDHWIRRSPVERHASEPTPVQAGPVPLRSFWNEPEPDDERQGLACISFAFAKGGRANLERGIELLQNAAARDNLHLEGWRKLGMAGLAKEDFRLARAAFQRALQLDTNDGHSHVGLGIALSSLGNSTSALTELEKAIQIAPDQLETYATVGAIHLRSGQLQRAVATLQQSLRVYPHQPEVLVMIGAAYCQDSLDVPRGIEAFQKAIQLDPDDVAMRVGLSSVYAAQGELEAASDQLQQALRLAPEHIPALLTSARVHIARGETAEAIECLDQALRVDPKNQYARQLLRELRKSAEHN